MVLCGRACCNYNTYSNMDYYSYSAASIKSSFDGERGGRRRKRRRRSERCGVVRGRIVCDGQRRGIGRQAWNSVSCGGVVDCDGVLRRRTKTSSSWRREKCSFLWETTRRRAYSRISSSSPSPSPSPSSPSTCCGIGVIFNALSILLPDQSTAAVLTSSSSPPTSIPLFLAEILPSSTSPVIINTIINALLWIERFLIDMTLSPLQTLLILAALTYFVFAPPGVLFGIIDFYLLNAFDKLAMQKKWSEEDFVLGRVRGRGNFGTVYEAFRSKSIGASGSSSSSSGSSAPRRRSGGNSLRGRGGGERDDVELPSYIVKRLKQDKRGTTIRDDFLRKGTIASGAGETGRAEMYMNGRMRRSMAGVTASYLGNFSVRETNGGFLKGEDFIVWKYESETTLEDYLKDPSYPSALEEVLYGRTREEDEYSVRIARVARNIMKQILRALAKFHETGLVHRDVKPSNMLVTKKGRLLIIDLGACADLRMGINFNPDEGLLDPDYCPPEKLVVPKSAPRSGSPLFAALGSPLFWLATAPDLFDTYSAGIIHLRMLIPTLHNGSFLSALNKELEKSDFDLRTWRESSEAQAVQSDYEAADRRFGLAWDLSCRLVCPRGAFFRGRMSAQAALSHPYFLL